MFFSHVVVNWGERHNVVIEVNYLCQWAECIGRTMTTMICTFAELVNVLKYINFIYPVTFRIAESISERKSRSTRFDMHRHASTIINRSSPWYQSLMPWNREETLESRNTIV